LALSFNNRKKPMRNLFFLLILISSVSCEIDLDIPLGCTNDLASNYDPDARKDDGSCIILSDSATQDLFGVTASFSVNWSLNLGGAADDYLTDFIHLSNGEYLAAGYTYSQGYSCGKGFGLWGDPWLVKLSPDGEIIWKSCDGITGFALGPTLINTGARINNIQEASLGGTDGYILGGSYGYDSWIAFINSFGENVWERQLSTNSISGLREEISAITMLDQYIYCTAGAPGSQNKLLCLSAQGDSISLLDLDQMSLDVVTGVYPTNDNGLALIGFNSNDVIISKVFPDSSSSIIDISWSKSFGGGESGLDMVQSAAIDGQGNIIVAGYTESNDGDIFENNGLRDGWVIKLASDGNMLWQQSIGGSSYDLFNDIVSTDDGGYIAVGSTESTDGRVNNSNPADLLGGSNFWIVKMSSLGVIEYQGAVGGSSDDNAISVASLSPSLFVVAGVSSSSDYYINQNNGGRDIWISSLTADSI